MSLRFILLVGLLLTLVGAHPIAASNFDAGHPAVVDCQAANDAPDESAHPGGGADDETDFTLFRTARPALLMHLGTPLIYYRAAAGTPHPAHWPQAPPA